ncbi:MAG: precorrin-3B C(17)-methyltransferase [Acidimicrobiales bacterium]
MRVLAVSVTEAGRDLVARLPYERQHGGLAATLQARWRDVDAFVLAVAVGAAVRVIAPLLSEKATDPGIVCVDDAGRHVVAVLGGHAASANHLANEVASYLGADPVITTATDSNSSVALDQLPGLVASGDVSAVTAALLHGVRPVLEVLVDWPLPDALTAVTNLSSETDRSESVRIIVTDRVLARRNGTAVLCPGSLVAGVGTSSEASLAEVSALLDRALDQHGLNRAAVASIATVDRRRHHEAIEGLGLPVTAYTPEALAGVAVPTPSRVVRDAVGTPSVAEAAALLAGGEGSRLLVLKQTSARATVAIVRRGAPPGRLTLVGLGPGGSLLRAPAATTALLNADTVIGFEGYLEQCSDLLSASQDVFGSPIGEEIPRARLAVEKARTGHSVAVVCSGDPGIYAMASLVFEEAGDVPLFPIEVIPGITAALAAAALLGAPLGHDHVVVSLSDLLTSWELIKSRIEAARDADLVVALYNPRSRQRDWQLEVTRDLLLEKRPGSTPVGIVTAAGRHDQQVTLTTLADLEPQLVGMTTCVIIGSSTTTVIGGRMVTPRGYPRDELR